ncbi:MAG: bifunctional molybdenum cofactor biosynthesis protein MoaC/MoaB [Chitinophagaceae bacterium]|nr:bifunctional molybdenum cofactor biosynthesis protein MoaC/MoaB [Chitinophagaceae bacterium]
MVNITHKYNTLRKAIASATVSVSDQRTITAIEQGTVPKGDVFEFSRAAGLLAVKKTSDVIPDCHPLPVEYTSIKHSIEGLNIIIIVEVHTVYKTGVEVEAMHGASITALTMYDMLKPIDKNVQISSIKLVSKTGGKSDTFSNGTENLKCAVVVCSDSVSQKKSEDKSGKAIVEKLKQYYLTATTDIIPDDRDAVQSKLKSLVAERHRLVIFTGGTGLSPRDVTPDAVEPLIERPIPGIMEAARNYGQQRTPYAMLSRGVAGFIKDTLVLTLPGSEKAATETMDALFPHILHVFRVAEGAKHE